LSLLECLLLAALGEDLQDAGIFCGRKIINPIRKDSSLAFHLCEVELILYSKHWNLISLILQKEIMTMPIMILYQPLNHTFRSINRLANLLDNLQNGLYLVPIMDLS